MWLSVYTAVLMPGMLFPCATAWRSRCHEGFDMSPVRQEPNLRRVWHRFKMRCTSPDVRHLRFCSGWALPPAVRYAKFKLFTTCAVRRKRRSRCSHDQCQTTLLWQIGYLGSSSQGQLSISALRSVVKLRPGVQLLAFQNACTFSQYGTQ